MILALEDGFSFYLLLVFIIVVSTFILTLYTGAILNIKLSENIAAEQKSFYAADSAITYAQLLLKENIGVPERKENGENYNKGEKYIQINLSNKSSFEFIINEKEDENIIYEIEALGKYNENISKIKASFNSNYQLIDYQILD